MTELQTVTAFNAFESQLKTLALQEFPCGIGRWKENYGKKRKQIEKDKVTSRYVVTLKDFGADFEKTETLEELVITKDSPWNLDYSWSNEAKDLREIAVRSPWLIDEKFVLGHFKTLRILNKDVTQVDENFLKFYKLEELSLSVNRIRTVDSRNLPTALRVLELCANNISTLADLCLRPPPGLTHLGLGHNSITMVDDYITGEYWPKLLSLDLCHNNLFDMMDIVRKLQTLPKLRNLILQGNPLALIPGYRGYTIDSLRKLSFLDDISISADEKHHFKGLAKRKEYILDEAKMVLRASYIKGVPMPEELKFPEEQPEFPVVTRKYFIQFMFLEDKSTNAEIFHILQDDQMTTGSPSTRETQTPSVNTLRTSEAGGGTFRSKEGAIAEVPEATVGQELPMVTLTAPTEGAKTEPRPGSHQSGNSHPGTVTPHPDEQDQEVTKAPVQCSPINSASSEWAEDIQLDWVKTVSRDDLIAFRDFLKEGMKIKVVEEKVEQYPADQFQQDEPASPAPSTKSKDGKKGEKDKKADKKDDKGKDKGKDDKGKGGDKGGDKKAKKKGEPEVELTAMPPEYRTLASFTIPLADFLDGEFEFENVYTKDASALQGDVSPTSEVSSKNKDKGKDKKKPGSAKKKDGKSEKDSLRGSSPPKRSSSRASRTESRVKSAKKDDKKDKKDAAKGKEPAKAEPEVDPSTPPPPLEIHVKVRLEHWKTAMDSMKADEDSEKQEGTEGQ